MILLYVKTSVLLDSELHTKSHPGLGWRIFHILTSEDIDYFADITITFGWKFLVIFGNVFVRPLANLRKVVGNPRKIVKNVVISMLVCLI